MLPYINISIQFIFKVVRKNASFNNYTLYKYFLCSLVVTCKSQKKAFLVILVASAYHVSGNNLVILEFLQAKNWSSYGWEIGESNLDFVTKYALFRFDCNRYIAYLIISY